MSKGTTLITSSMTESTLKFAWNVGKLQDLMGINKNGLTIRDLDLFPNCETCRFDLNISKPILSHDGYIRATIMTLRKLDLSNRRDLYNNNHLHKAHNVHHAKWIGYLLGSDELRKFECSSDSSVYCSISISQQGMLDNSAVCLNNGFVEFRMEIKMTKQVNLIRSLPRPTSSTKTLAEDMKRLLESGYQSDFEIETGGDTFRVHKSVLATRSPVFKAMFEAGMEESRENMVKLDYVDASVVKKFIHYIYTDELELEESEDYELAMELLKLADQYQVDALRALCGDRLAEKLSASSAADVLSLADTYRCENLREATLEFISVNRQTFFEEIDVNKLLSLRQDQ